ncbi:GNAT family N-acetyltransferase [Kribbella qitaiheensis]|uniref:GNAT family N-acetyltransferase n=1 Tax=Kribbella qitaiheensis TaxID=1544730 RepID=A0A7G6WSN7_9ACTN|nr:GNAT family N-acetyltransferase [Kribbella qitaiheensis]QNE17002.1 GNAT family N-acetyltransferase [Kribbella qitaiheensis]
MADSEFVVRVATAAEHDRFVGLFAAAMMFESSPDDLDRELFEPERALVVMDGDEFVGTAKAMSRDLSVPGAVVPAAHVTAVGVRSTHRRQGILSGLMGRQLREVPEALAVLWASESGIYGRFGYAPAAWVVSYEADLHRVKPHPVRGDLGGVEEIRAEEALPLLARMLGELQARRPGVSGRSEQLWRKRLQDQPEHRGGMTARHVLVHRDGAGIVDGYVLWRGKMGWGPTGPASEVVVEEVVAVEPTAYHALWYHLLTLDLAAKLEYGKAAVDEPLQQLVSSPVALGRRVTESLWVRLTDVPRALAQRRYATSVDVVIEVTDHLVEANNGRFRLIGDTGHASCERSESTPDLSMSVTELAGAYLGARPLAEFAATGRVTEHTPGALSAATSAFGWPAAPVSLEIF